jgi:peptidyl-prolyl cis-trans isomerase D
MLKSMRKNLKSLAPTLWFVIIAFIISIFAVWGGAGRLGEGGGTDTLVTVGKEKISVSVYYQTLRQRLEAMRQQYRDLDSQFIQQLNIPQQILNQLIQQSLLMQLSRDMGIEATDDEIRKKIMSYPAFQKDGQFIGFAQYQKILDWNRIPLPEFEKSLRQETIMEKVVDVLTAGVTVTEEELWENYQRVNDTARIEYVLLELDKVQWDGQPAPDELTDYFEKNKDSYTIPEKREADYYFVKTEDLKTQVELTDVEIENYYEENTARFKEPEKIKASRIYLTFEDQDRESVRNRANDLLTQIKEGTDFGELARLYSKDDKAAESGDWGLYEWKSLSQQEQDEINRLSQDEISDIVEIDEGIAILKVTEKEPESTQPLELVSERIANILKDEKARQLAEEEISRLEKAAKKEKSLDVAAQTLGLGIRSSGLLKLNDPLEDIDPSGSISMTLFNLAEKEISSPIYTYQGVGLAQLMKIEPPRPAKFEEVEQEVAEDFTALKKKDLAIERIQRVKEALGRKTLENLAEDYEMEYKTVEEHKRGQYIGVIGENQEIDELAFSLPLNEASDPVEFEAGYALVRVLDRKEVTKEEFEAEKATEKENFLEMKRNKFFSSYLAKLQEDKEVKIRYDLFLQTNQDILSRFGGEQE